MAERSADPDADLIGKFKDGTLSLKEYEALVRRVEGGIRAFVEKHQFGDCQIDPTNFAADACVEAYARLDGFRGDCRFIHWVRRIAHHKVCAHLRRTQRARFEGLDDALEITDGGPGPEGQVMSDEEDEFRELVREEGLKQLTDKERAAVLSKFERESLPLGDPGRQDLSDESIAVRSGGTANAVRMDRSRGMKKLGAFRKDQGC